MRRRTRPRNEEYAPSKAALRATLHIYMTAPSVGVSTPSVNRFEQFLARGRHRRLSLVAVAIVFVLLFEFVFELVVLGFVFVRGHDYDLVARQLFLTSVILRPFLPPLAAESVPGIRYVGPLSGYPDSSRLWFPADGVLGHRLGINLAITDPFQWRLTNDQGFASSGQLSYHYTTAKPADTYR